MKKLFVLCMAVISVFSFSACAGKTQSTSSASESNAVTTSSAVSETGTAAEESTENKETAETKESTTAEESTSKDGGSELLKAALSAYREQLEANKSAITNETGLAYQYPSNPVSFADVTGDGVPELFYTYAETTEYTGIYGIYMVVYAYSGGGLYQLLDPVVYQNGHADVFYNMYFTAEGSETLYLMSYSNGGNVHLNYLELTEYEYSAADGTMICKSTKKCDYLTEAGKATYKDVQGWSDSSSHEENGTAVSSDECMAENAQLFNSVSSVIIVSPDESGIQKGFEEDEHLGFAGAFSDIDNISMTYEEAIAYIDGM